MTHILHSGAHIWAAQPGPFTITADAVLAVDAILPLGVIGEYSIVEAEVPADFHPGSHDWDEQEGTVKKKPEPPMPAAEQAAIKSELAREVDESAREVIARYTVLSRIYERREAEAKAYRDAGYEGTPGEFILNFAGPAKMTPEAAAKLVLRQADGLRQAEPMLEGLRMQKNAVLLAETVEEARSIAIAAMQGIAQIAAKL